MLIAISAWTFEAGAEIFYVSKTGDNSNDGSAIAPFLTVQKAIDSLTADGDEVWISPGDYNEAVISGNTSTDRLRNIKVKGTADGVIITAPATKSAFKLNYADNWVLQNIKLVGNGETSNVIVDVMQSPGARIENCTVSGGSTSNICYRAVYILSSPNFIVKNCTIDAYCENSIFSSESNNLLIKGNDVSNADSITIGFDKGCDYTTCEENYIHDRITPGQNEKVIIQCRDNVGSILRRNLIVEFSTSFLNAILVRGPSIPAEDITVENNTLIGPGAQTGIAFAANSLSSICRNNIVSGFYYAVRTLYPSSELPSPEVELNFNDFYDCTTSVSNTVNLFNIGSSNISSDPLFADTAEYRLSEGSPCIDTGDPASLVPTGGGTTVDMGRWEYRDSIYENNQSSIYLSSILIDFGTVEDGQTKSIDLTLSNEGNADLSVSSIGISGSSAFTLNSSPAVPFTITAEASITLQVDYKPIEALSDTATIIITSNDPDQGTASVLLTGTGTPSVVPHISADKESLDFKTVIVGSSRTLSVTISNTGIDDLVVSNLLISGSSLFDLNELVPETPFTVSIGSSVIIPVDFVPYSAEPSAGTLTIESDDPDQPELDVSLSAEGYDLTVKPKINVSTESLDFDKVVYGLTSTLTVIASNTGNTALSISNISITGSSDFSLAELDMTFPYSVPFGSSLNIPVIYNPSGITPTSATITINSDDEDEPQVSVLLNGGGYDEENSPIDLGIESFTVDKRIGLTSTKPIEIGITVKNNGVIKRGSSANVVGFQNDLQVYDETIDISGDNSASYWFPSYTPELKGQILWLASIKDSSDEFKQETAMTYVFSGDVSPVWVTPNKTSIAADEKMTFKAFITGKKIKKKNLAWYVNNIPGGNSTVGTIKPSKNRKSGVYTAPSVLPYPSTVVITFVNKKKTSQYGSAEVTIEE